MKYGFIGLLSAVAFLIAAGGAVAAAEVATEEESAATAAGSPGPFVARSMFTTGVVDREPQNQVTELTNDQQKIFYFTEIQNLEGEKVTHRWEFNGQVVAEVSFDVGASRWRTYSSKDLEPIWLGEWTVSVVDSSDNVLSSETFVYAEPAETPPPASPEP